MNNEQDYIETGSKMAQALQDIIDDTCEADNCKIQTERCPTHAPDLTALVDEWEQLYSRSALGPQQQTQNAELDDGSFIASLGLTHLTPQAG